MATFTGPLTEASGLGVEDIAAVCWSRGSSGAPGYVPVGTDDPRIAAWSAHALDDGRPWAVLTYSDLALLGG